MSNLLGLLARFRRLRFLVREYDDETYWKDRGKGYSSEFDNMSPELRAEFSRQEALIVDALGDMHFTSALEIGCGFGRVLGVIARQFPDVRLAGCDVSEDQIRAAEEHLSGHLWRCQLMVGSLHSLNFGTFGPVDLVYTSEVLTHIKDPLPIIAKMLDGTKKYVMHIEWSEAAVQPKAPWVFNHDYKDIYTGLGYAPLKILDVVRGQQIFLIDKKDV